MRAKEAIRQGRLSLSLLAEDTRSGGKARGAEFNSIGRKRERLPHRLLDRGPQENWIDAAA